MNIVVVGAGPAGMIAAGIAAQNGANVTLVERNNILAKKLRITGKGRCNVLNFCSVQEFLNNVTVNSKFLFSSINNFTPQQTFDFFQDLGLKLKTERGNRVFPKSDKAIDVVLALEKFIRKAGCEILNKEVKQLIFKNKTCTGIAFEDGKILLADKVILACGGCSYPRTGSDGTGYRLAKKAGHKIITPKASLVPLVIKENWCKKLQGLSLKNVSLKLIDTYTNEIIFKDFGEMIFTHFGVSGPIILSASAHIKNMQKERYKLFIDLKPALAEKKLDQRILRDFEKNINKDFINSLNELLPQKLIPIIVELCKIPQTLKCNEISKEMRKDLIVKLKNLCLTITDFRPIEEAIITSGGINTKEINPKTMESRICKNLFFAGEIIDVDAYTGGFNLQIAFCSGKAAGIGASY